MIDLYFAPTPNGWKITIMLEECGVPYQIVPVNIGAGEQFSEDFLAISPNSRIPAIVDHQPLYPGHQSISIFESGAILLYLAEKSSQFLPSEPYQRSQVSQWLFWQMANLGPMGGQASHFVNYAPENNNYSKQRYLDEYDRLLGVMNFQLQKSPYLAGDEFSIADIASFPWLLPCKHYGIAMDDFTHLRRWFNELKQRPALRRGVDIGKDSLPAIGPDQQTRDILFGQTSSRYKKTTKD